MISPRQPYLRPLSPFHHHTPCLFTLAMFWRYFRDKKARVEFDLSPTVPTPKRRCIVVTMYRLFRHYCAMGSIIRPPRANPKIKTGVWQSSIGYGYVHYRTRLSNKISSAETVFRNVSGGLSLEDHSEEHDFNARRLFQHYHRGK